MRSSATEGGTGMIRGVVDIGILFADFMNGEVGVCRRSSAANYVKQWIGNGTEHAETNRNVPCHGISANGSFPKLHRWKKLSRGWAHLCLFVHRLRPS